MLALEGEICVSTVPVLIACLDALDATATAHVVVDLSKVSMLTAQGIGVLVRAKQRHEDLGGSLWLRGATGLVARVLDLTGAAEHLCRPTNHHVLPAVDLDERTRSSSSGWITFPLDDSVAGPVANA